MRKEVKNRIIIALVLLMAAPLAVFSQTLEEAQKAYNAGVVAKQEGNLEEAINQFDVCNKACEYLVDEMEDETAEELMYTVQGAIPTLYYQLGMEQLQNQEVQKGIDNIYKAKEVAGLFGNQDIADKATKVIPQIHYKIGASKYKKGDLEGAIAELDKGIAADADYASVYYLKAVVLKKKEDDAAFKQTALDGIAAALRSNDVKTKQKIEDLGLKYFLKKGNDAKGAEKYDEAVTNLTQALEFDENDGTTLFLLTSTYSAQGNYSKAIETGEKAVAAETGGAEAKAKIYLVIAEAEAKKGNNSAACAAYKKAAVGQFAEHANYQMEHVLKCQ